MSALGFHMFKTAIGPCLIAWGDAGIVGVQLPDSTQRFNQVRLRPRLANARRQDPPAHIAGVVEDIQKLLTGESRDLSAAPLDFTGVSELDRRVYEIARSIKPGQTLTYGDIAVRLGDRTLSRAVGQILGRNPFPIIVPCHRVVAAGGRAGGFSAPGGVATKRRLLDIEGAQALHPTLPWDR